MHTGERAKMPWHCQCVVGVAVSEGLWGGHCWVFSAKCACHIPPPSEPIRTRHTGGPEAVNSRHTGDRNRSIPCTGGLEPVSSVHTGDRYRSVQCTRGTGTGHTGVVERTRGPGTAVSSTHTGDRNW